MELKRWIDPDLLAFELLGTSVEHWLLLLAAVGVAMAALVVLRRFVGSWLRRYSGTPRTTAEPVLEVLLRTTRGYFLFALALAFAASLVGWSDRGRAAVLGLLSVAFLLQAGRWGNGLIGLWARRRSASGRAVDAAGTTTVAAISVVARVLLWAVVLLMLLDNVGVDVTALVAGLGIGGIVIGFALQSVLGDVFASLSVLLDKPFVVGDFLVVGELLGSVEQVGLKSTRLRSLGGEQIVIANSRLLDGSIHNYGRMRERRVVFPLRVAYDTPPEQVEAIAALAGDIVRSQEGVRLDRAHFRGHGEWALEFEFVYYVLSPDFNRYMDVHEAIALEIHRSFAARGIRFAFPTRTLHLEGALASAPAGWTQRES